MASRTQLRLGQITGSFGTSAINDQIAAAATGSIATTDLQGVLSHLAGAIKRIHGEDSFSQNAAGEFAVTLQPSSNDGGALGGSDNNWSDLYLADGAVINLGDDQDVNLTHIPDVGVRLNGGSELQFRDTDLVISSSADGTLDIEADTQINIGTDRSGIAISLGHTTSEVTINDNLTVTGDLTVNGTQTVLDTTSLVIEDSVIALSSGSSANADVNAAVIFQRNTANLGGDNDKTNGALMFLQGTGFKLGYTSDTAETAQGSLAVADDDLGELYVGQLSIAGASDNIAISGGALVATAAGDFKIDSATDIYLDAAGGDIFLQNAASTFLQLQDDPNSEGYAVLSSSAGKNIALVDNGGIIGFWKNDAADGNINMSLYLDDSGVSNEIKFLVDDQNARLTLAADFANEMSGSLLIDGGGDPGALRLKEAGEGNTNYVELNVPTTISAPLQLTLPGSDGSNGQVLKTNGSGVLSFGDATGDLARFAYKATSAVAAGNVDFGSSKTAGITALPVGTADLNITKANADLNDSLEVYVNGQLLISGSDGGADTDYTFIDSDTLKFAFGLEADDIIQIIQR